eukprot:m.217870 g.217870  ORF g.217870 m.217870 type:complete len:625 (-) comp15892_c1_seq26:1294-3168(-)
MALFPTWLLPMLPFVLMVATAHTSGSCDGNVTMMNGTCCEGNTYKTVKVSDLADCCDLCAEDGNCGHFTYNTNDTEGPCRLKTGPVGHVTTSETCISGAKSQPPPPPPPPKPPTPPPSPPNPNAPRPNIVMVVADDLGWYDTEIYNPNSPTPRLKALADSGMRLDRHYVFRYCSPTRRSFMSGRIPNHITTVQPDGSNMCSDFLPLAFEILPEKMNKAGYQCHFVGKGHLGYETTNHLPINRGFKSHVGYLGGAEGYFWGGGKEDPTDGTHDMWHDTHPGTDIVPEIFYSANFYANYTKYILDDFDKSMGPLFLYLAFQNVHSPYQSPPEWENFPYPAMWNPIYANMLHMLDVGVDNVTQALMKADMWNNTLLVFTADNGGIGNFGNNHPLRGHKHDPWEGGIRATAFMAGGFLPSHMQGVVSGDKLVHISDWYATFCTLAGIDYHDYAYMNGSIHDVDSVDVWPMLSGANNTQPRPITAVTEASIIYTMSSTSWMKLVTLAGQSNYYSTNATQIPGNDTCLEARQPDPPQPGRTDPIVNGKCPVCNSTNPCLYDILADPSETKNIAGDHPDIISMLAPILAESLKAYVSGHLSAYDLQNYTQINTKEAWGGYTGPCYKPKGEL